MKQNRFVMKENKFNFNHTGFDIIRSVLNSKVGSAYTHMSKGWRRLSKSMIINIEVLPVKQGSEAHFCLKLYFIHQELIAEAE